MNKLTKLAFLGLALVSMLGLSACSTEFKAGDFTEISVTMKDGRTVPCIYRTSNWFDCDWASATVPAPRVPAIPTPPPTK
jgi:hypothetical protein